MKVLRGTVAGMKMLCGRKRRGRETVPRGGRRETKIGRERVGDEENGER